MKPTQIKLTMTTQKRLLFVDNLRILLIVLVVLHHVAITYGAPGGWYYSEGRQPGMISAFFLTLFVAVNQAFFMGFFFLISGYFTPGAYDRKGARQFLKDRLLRLGIPLALYITVLHPFTLYVSVIGAEALRVWRSFPEFFLIFLKYFRYIVGVGPLWFVETLLIFAFIYSACRAATSSNVFKKAPTHAKPPSPLQIAGLALGLGVVSFGVRIWLPIGWNLKPLGLQFPFFPQYIALFVSGIVAFRRNWLLTISDEVGKRGLAVVLVWIVLLFPTLTALGGALEGNRSPFMGGLHWQALAYALWEQTVGVAMIIGLLTLFRRRFNRQGRLANAMSQSAYTVYIIHAPIVVFLGLLFRPIDLPPLLKFALVGPMAVSLCFLFGDVIRRLPVAKRIL